MFWSSLIQKKTVAFLPFMFVRSERRGDVLAILSWKGVENQFPCVYSHSFVLLWSGVEGTSLKVFYLYNNSGFCGAKTVKESLVCSCCEACNTHTHSQTHTRIHIQRNSREGFFLLGCMGCRDKSRSLNYKGGLSGLLS